MEAKVATVLQRKAEQVRTTYSTLAIIETVTVVVVKTFVYCTRDCTHNVCPSFDRRSVTSAGRMDKDSYITDYKAYGTRRGYQLLITNAIRMK